MSFSTGQSVKFTKQFASRINPNAGMTVHKRASEVPDCVWVEFVGLPALDNLRLIPTSMLESA